MIQSVRSSTEPMPSVAGRHPPPDAIWQVAAEPSQKSPSFMSAASLKPIRLWLLVCGICLVLGLAEAAQTYWMVRPEEGPPIGGWRSLGLGLGVWCTWALLWPIAYAMSRWLPLCPQHWRNRLPLHFLVSIACVLIKLTFDYPVIKTCYCPKPEILTFTYFFPMAFAGYSLRYLSLFWAMVGVNHALEFYSKYRDAQLREALLETGLTRARLQLLKTQLHPHFLFNTLNAIAALIYTDPEVAERMVARLGDLMRLALEDYGLQEAPLARELEVLRAYLDIEQTRLGSRLRVDWRVEPEVTDALVPTFLLQPLIENAIRHGIAPRKGPGRIEVRAWHKDGELFLEVHDDGPGLRNGTKPGNGVGLANTRERLLHLYGAGQRLEIGNDTDGGCLARVVLPFYEPVANGADAFGGQDDTHPDRR